MKEGKATAFPSFASVDCWTGGGTVGFDRGGGYGRRSFVHDLLD
jgi:hypothetical protein